MTFIGKIVQNSPSRPWRRRKPVYPVGSRMRAPASRYGRGFGRDYTNSYCIQSNVRAFRRRTFMSAPRRDVREQQQQSNRKVRTYKRGTPFAWAHPHCRSPQRPGRYSGGNKICHGCNPGSLFRLSPRPGFRLSAVFPRLIYNNNISHPVQLFGFFDPLAEGRRGFYPIAIEA